MAISLKHTFNSPKADGVDSTLVQPSNWNAEHTITLAAGKVLGRDTSGAGAMQELPLAFDTAGNAALSATGSFKTAAGTTAQRPGTPSTGMFRFNTSLGKFEGYSGSAWASVGGGGAAISDTAPASPSAGDLWWNSTDGQMYTYYNDGTSSQWVIANAFTNASAYLPLTGGTLTGALVGTTAAFSTATIGGVAAVAVAPGTAGNVLTSNGTTWTSAAFASIPAGSILYYPSVTAPTGYLAADGAIYSRSAYPALAATIGAPALPSNPTLELTIPAQVANKSYRVHTANNVGFMTGTASSTTAPVANGLYTSTNGTTWTLRTGMNFDQETSYGTGYRAAFGNGAYVLITGMTFGFRVQRSTDLTTWTSYATGGLHGPTIAFGGTSNRFVIVSADSLGSCCTSAPSVRYSSDGITWTTAATAGSMTQSSSGQYYVAGSPDGFIITIGGQIWRSTDGNTWTNITADAGGAAASKVHYVNGRFVIISSSSVWTSITGAATTWSLVGTLPIQAGAYPDLTWNGSMYVVSTTSTSTYTIQYSPDLITWGFKSVTPGGLISFSFSGVIGAKFIAANTNATTAAGGALVAKSVYSMTSAGYDLATQFPVPFVPKLGAVNGSAAFAINPFVKT